MSDSYVQVAPNSTGAEVATRQIVVSGNTVQLQCVVLGDPSTADYYVGVQPKGTQGTYAAMTQDFKDSGRTPITLFVIPVAGQTAETLMTITQMKGGVTETAATNYTVTSGKTFRITSFNLFGTQTVTTSTWARGFMRYTTSGTVTTTTTGAGPSPCVLMAQTAGITTTTCSMTPLNLNIDDGYEIPSGSNYGISSQCLSANCTVGMCVTGFEY